MSTNMGNLEKLGILVIVILVVVVGVVAITPKSATVDPLYPDGQSPGEVAKLPEALESGGAPTGETPGQATPAGTDPWPDKATTTPLPGGAAPAQTADAPNFRIITVAKSDTLASIAKRELGSSLRYRDIQDANPGLTATTKLTPGMEIKIPLAPTVAKPVAGGPSTAPSSVPSASSPGVTSPKGAKAPVPTDSLAGEKTYVVKSGDTLSSIAGQSLGSTKRWPEIAKVNEDVLNGSTSLKIGMKLRIPAAGSGGEAPALASRDVASTPHPTATGAHDYTVKAGDSLWSIARTEMGSDKLVAELKDANSDVLNGSTVLKIGMKLRIPARK